MSPAQLSMDLPNAARGESAVAVSRVTKAFPGVVALDDVDLAVSYGEVHAIVGLNGAGKSTLVNILAGSLVPDSGSVWVGDAAETADLAEHVAFVPQDVVMVPSMSIGRNAILGSESFLSTAQLSPTEQAAVAKGFARVGLDLNPDFFPAECSVPELRLVQIARALMSGKRVLLLDEPTAVLGHGDSDRLIETLHGLRAEGEAIVYVSHRLGEVLRVADRITVLRDGRVVSTVEAEACTRSDLLEMLSGANVEKAGAVPSIVSDELPFLRVEGLTAAVFEDVNLEARPGEVVALVGVPGGGQSQVVQALSGLATPVAGQVFVGEKSVTLGSVSDSYRAGLVLVPADRRTSGVVTSASVAENIVLSPGSRSHLGGMRLKRLENMIVDSYQEAFGLVMRSRRAAVATLSGGNQQKVALAKALESKPRVLLLDEPTQGIDVASKGRILEDIKVEARTSGRAILSATSELEEVVGWADRVYVFRLGSIQAELSGENISEDALIEFAVP